MPVADAEPLEIADEREAVIVVAHDRNQRDLGSEPGDILRHIAGNAAERAFRGDRIGCTRPDRGQGTVFAVDGSSADADHSARFALHVADPPFDHIAEQTICRKADQAAMGRSTSSRSHALFAGGNPRLRWINDRTAHPSRLAMTAW